HHPAGALLVVEVARDDGAATTLDAPAEELRDPGVALLRHRHTHLDLDVVVLGLRHLPPEVGGVAHLVGHDLGLDAAALDRPEEPGDMATIQLEDEARRRVGAVLVLGSSPCHARLPRDRSRQLDMIRYPVRRSSWRRWDVQEEENEAERRRQGAPARRRTGRAATGARSRR